MYCVALQCFVWRSIIQTSLSVDGISGFSSKNLAAKIFIQTVIVIAVRIFFLAMILLFILILIISSIFIIIIIIIMVIIIIVIIFFRILIQ